MDEISRDLPPDTTTADASGARPADAPTGGKGPEELLRYERAQIAEDLVVRDRFGGSLSASAAMNEAEQPGPGDDDVPPSAESAPGDAAPADAGEQAEQAELADQVDPDAAAAAVLAEADVAEIEEDLGGDDEGLPSVPELSDAAAVARVVFVLMLTSREGLSLFRLAQACNTTQKLVEEALALLQQQLTSLGLAVELARTGDTVKWMSGAESFAYLQRLRGVKKLEKLSPAALETLAVIAYRQPVMRGEIEAIRGVKAGPMLRTLLQHKLVRVTGRADVPGRPLQYGTTQHFLERFGIHSVQELPSIKEWKNLG